jgi:hypothetical protein
VDPLGLRQLNFNLMDRAHPGLNNVASRLRIYFVLAWAWWKAAELAAREGKTSVSAERLRSFVDRVEVIYATSHLIHDDFMGFLGRDTLNARVVKPGGYDFGAPAWKKFRSDRELISSFMAPVAYGPSAKIGMGLGVISPADGGVFTPVEEVLPAVRAFDTCLGPLLDQPAFSSLDAGEVSLETMASFYQHWRASDLTSEEIAAGRERLHTKLSAEARRNTIDLIGQVLQQGGRAMQAREIRAALGSMTVNGHAVEPAEGLAGTLRLWRSLQARQLLRLALESLLSWVLAECTVPRSTGDLAERLLDVAGARDAMTIGEWLEAPFSSALASDPVSHPVELLELLENERQRERPDLALEGIKSAVLIARSEASPTEGYSGQLDRLPLTLLSERLEQMATFSLREGFEIILSEWIIGQHIYWAVGRSGDDTQRLRIMLDEGGWLSFYSTPGNARATPDRLETVLRLLSDCGIVNEDRTQVPFLYSAPLL